MLIARNREISAGYALLCSQCAAEVPERPYVVACPQCGGALHFSYVASACAWDESERSMWRYRSLLPAHVDSSPLTLQEGLTPLPRSRSAPAGMQLFLKNETMNPTGSHKDRALSVGVTKAVEFGCRAVMLYSDGSTALSSAAYAARGGLRSITLVARGTPDYRLLPLMVYNSTVFEYQGDPAEALEWTREACHKLQIYETTSYRRANPYEAEGPKTISFEIVEQLGRAPDWVVIPVGGGGTLCGIWRGFQELHARGHIANRPRLAAVFPAGYSRLEQAFRQGVSSESELCSLASGQPPPTIQAKIAMQYPPDGLEAIEAMRESDGLFFYASDEQVIKAQGILAGREGIFAEPSAAGVLVATEALAEKALGQNETVVAVVTGSGFREIGALTGSMPVSKASIDAASGIDQIRRWLHDE